MMHELEPLCDRSGRVIYFPVRHHSPTAARLVGQFIRDYRPARVLIEGPSDYNPMLHELLLEHQPPVAIFSYVVRGEDDRLSVYYPFCVYSPEWQAVQVAGQCQIPSRFIDLPLADMPSSHTEANNRYADGQLRHSRYIQTLSEKLGINGFDELWDRYIEIEPNLTLDEYFRRAHLVCVQTRLLDEMDNRVSDFDTAREAFMANQVRAALAECDGQILLVTGGYHSLGIYQLLTAPPKPSDPATAPPNPPTTSSPILDRGIALTPYTYARLDSLTGYNAGMPNPGFYHQLWLDTLDGRTDTHRTLVGRVAAMLRQRGQPISTADLIAQEATIRGLAALRGHPRVWRTDLLDGTIAALIKDDLTRLGKHPLLDAVHEVLRGGERGRLAEDTTRPPLVREIEQQLLNHDLLPDEGYRPRQLRLDLNPPIQPGVRGRSQILHRLRLLEIPGFNRIDGTDFLNRDDLSDLWESWQISRDPDFEARCIESARYGLTLREACTARLVEQTASIDRDAAKAAELMLAAALAGLTQHVDMLYVRLRALIHTDANFVSVSAALEHLLYLYRYDNTLQTQGQHDLGRLLREAFTRGLWLLEGLGRGSGQEVEICHGVAALCETFERSGPELGIESAEVIAVFRRVHAEASQSPAVRGAALGVLWVLNATDTEQLQRSLRQFSDPEVLGDYLVGLFMLAREAIQRDQQIVLVINQLLAQYPPDDFLAALPAMRLAFTAFTPREKYYLAKTIRAALGLSPQENPAPLAVTPEQAAAAISFEQRLIETLTRYGLPKLSG